MIKDGILGVAYSICSFLSMWAYGMRQGDITVILVNVLGILMGCPVRCLNFRCSCSIGAAV